MLRHGVICRWRPAALVLLSLVIFSNACHERLADTVNVAVVVDLSGPTKDFGEAVVAGAKFAAKATSGPRIQVMTKDDHNSPKLAQQIALELAADPSVVAVIGGSSSATTEAAEEVYGRYEIPYVLPVATKTQISEGAWARGYRNLIPLVPTNDAQAWRICEFVTDTLKISRPLLINDYSSYGSDLGQDLEKCFKAEHRPALLRKPIESAGPAGADYSSVVESIERYRPDLLVFAGYQHEATYLVQQIRESDAGKHLPIVLSDGCFSTDLFANVPDAFQNVFVAFLLPDWHALPAVQALAREFCRSDISICDLSP